MIDAARALLAPARRPGCSSPGCGGSDPRIGTARRALARRSVAIDYASLYAPIEDVRRLVAARAAAVGAEVTFSDDAGRRRRAGDEPAALDRATRGGFKAIAVAAFDPAAVEPIAAAAIRRGVRIVSYVTPLAHQTAAIAWTTRARGACSPSTRPRAGSGDVLLVRPAATAIPDPFAPRVRAGRGRDPRRPRRTAWWRPSRRRARPTARRPIAAALRATAGSARARLERPDRARRRGRRRTRDGLRRRARRARARRAATAARSGPGPRCAASSRRGSPTSPPRWWTCRSRSRRDARPRTARSRCTCSPARHGRRSARSRPTTRAERTGPDTQPARAIAGTGRNGLRAGASFGSWSPPPTPSSPSPCPSSSTPARLGWLERRADGHEPGRLDRRAKAVVSIAESALPEVERFCAQWAMTVQVVRARQRGRRQGPSLAVEGFTAITAMYRR